MRLGPQPSREDEKRIHDVCIIGSGAAGSVAAALCVEAGLSVLVLEQGPFLDNQTTYDEVVQASEPALARQPNGCWGLNGYPWTTCNVGGGTVFYGGASFRYRVADFDAGEYMGDADLPVAWPYSYEDLNPYYDHIEQVIGLSAAPPEADPNHPPKAITNLPPLPPSAGARHLYEAARRLQLNPFPTPLAIASTPHRGRPACGYSSACIEHRCTEGAKGDAFTVFLEPLFRSPRFHLLAGMKAVRLERRRRDQVERVSAVRVDTGQTFSFRARAFLVACNAIQSAGLLLQSTDGWSPDGIGNEHDMVGRGLCMKLNEFVVGYKDGPDPEDATGRVKAEEAGPFSTFAVTDFYFDSEAPTGMGGLIYENRYGRTYRMRHSGNVLRLECILADQPSRDNRVTLSRQKDAYGAPRLAIDYTPHPRDLARLESMVEHCRQILEAAGCRWIRRESGDFHLGSCHLHGTCRAGTDERFSVLDPWSRVHSVENLFVVDGAFMPFPSGMNPTLTIQAHSLRATEHALSEFWGVKN